MQLILFGFMFCAFFGLQMEQSTAGQPSHAGGMFEMFADRVEIVELYENSDASIHGKKFVVVVLGDETRGRGSKFIPPLRDIINRSIGGDTGRPLKIPARETHKITGCYIGREASAVISEVDVPIYVSRCAILYDEAGSNRFFGRGNERNLITFHSVELPLHDAQLALKYARSNDANQNQSSGEPSNASGPIRYAAFVSLVWSFIFLAAAALAVLCRLKARNMRTIIAFLRRGGGFRPSLSSQLLFGAPVMPWIT
jgi:hypothetical protein